MTNALLDRTTLLKTVDDMMLAPADISLPMLDTVLGDMRTGAASDADIYMQYKRSESWSLDDGIVRDGSHSIQQGAGLRVVSGDKTGFAYADDLSLPSLQRSAALARAITRQGQDAQQKIEYTKNPVVPIANSLYAAFKPVGFFKRRR